MGRAYEALLALVWQAHALPLAGDRLAQRRREGDGRGRAASSSRRYYVPNNLRDRDRRRLRRGGRARAASRRTFGTLPAAGAIPRNPTEEPRSRASAARRSTSTCARRSSPRAGTRRPPGTRTARRSTCSRPILSDGPLEPAVPQPGVRRAAGALGRGRLLGAATTAGVFLAFASVRPDASIDARRGAASSRRSSACSASRVSADELEKAKRQLEVGAGERPRDEPRARLAHRRATTRPSAASARSTSGSRGSAP